ncbi:hypothetical protein B0E45_07940 [Sinorhizobium sp. A49]|jgi:hypothetical protein|uniref:hypothetical protein n=1 Tax=Sinorhizobium sp. A49 TaxID=1945861 RepID=UPI000985CD51|nr:hypothetical protein [Sinorhizobium sp. A49]OOG72909.1 hypothetical protein B0E45_07940 [Sinorhizobium sp. A49]
MGHSGYETGDNVTRAGVVDEVVETISESNATLTPQAQLEALRAEIANLRGELGSIISGTSRLAVTEAAILLETTQNRIRSHLAPILIAAGVIGYLWGASRR